MRTVKDPLERRAEILDAAQHLFTTKGYGKTTIIDILNAIGIAKGTFYYYFKSKEEVMDAIIQRIVDADVAAAKTIATQQGRTPPEKLLAILLAQTPANGAGKAGVLAQFQDPANAGMQQRSLALSIRGLAPILATVVDEGNAAGQFHCTFPKQTIEFLLAGAQIMFDSRLFPFTPAEKSKQAEAFIQMMEKALTATPGTFTQIESILT